MLLTKTNIFLAGVLVAYLVCCSKYIGTKNHIFTNQIYLLILLICVIIIYPYNKQAGITLLLIVMISKSPVFLEQFESSSPTSTPTPNELESIESNYNQTIDKRRQQSLDEKLSKEDTRMNLLEEEGNITPLEREIVREIQRQFEEDIDLITTDDFEKISKYTDEGDPINAGLLPKEINQDKYGIDYNQLVRIGKVIKF
jgi:hypothetical protein